jgi:hypothetical protein
MPNRRGALLPGLLLILLGAWLLATTLGVRLPDLSQLWPLVLLFFGLAALVQYFAEGRRSDGLVFTGVAAALLGAFFLAITLGPLEWSDLARYWPVFVLIGGAAFLAQWLARPAGMGLLVPAGLAIVVGLAALALTRGLLDPALTAQAVRLWPVLLILLGLGLLIRYARGGRAKKE